MANTDGSGSTPVGQPDGVVVKAEPAAAGPERSDARLMRTLNRIAIALSMDVQQFFVADPSSERDKAGPDK